MRRAALNGWGYASLTLAWLLMAACEDAPKPAAPQAPVSAAREEPPAPRREVAPGFAIDTLSPKVGFERALLQNPEGRGQLARLLAAQKPWISGKPLTLEVDRKANVAWVSAYVDELGALGVGPLTIQSDTRKDYAHDQRFTPERTVSASPCSVVAMITPDRGTAVWKLTGGVASKRGKGMGGPDLTMTGETIERIAKTCKASKTFFVAAAEGVEWGLLYDLGASSRRLPDVSFEETVLLAVERPVPGHAVKLRR